MIGPQTCQTFIRVIRRCRKHVHFLAENECALMHNGQGNPALRRKQIEHMSELIQIMAGTHQMVKLMRSRIHAYAALSRILDQ